MGRVVALKILLPEFQADNGAVQTFLAEASAKANVQHPSILSVYEAGQSEGIYYYTREFVDGANLAYLRAQGRTMDHGSREQADWSSPLYREYITKIDTKLAKRFGNDARVWGCSTSRRSRPARSRSRAARTCSRRRTASLSTSEDLYIHTPCTCLPTYHHANVSQAFLSLSVPVMQTEAPMSRFHKLQQVRLIAQRISTTADSEKAKHEDAISQ